jgi:hypothetical protein
MQDNLNKYARIKYKEKQNKKVPLGAWMSLLSVVC